MCLYTHMKKFTRVKKVGGHQYVYEITPYYDKQTKNSKQKSKYLGTLVNGDIRRPRSSPPRSSFDYGEFLPFMKVMDELSVKSILHSLLPRQEADSVLTLALNRLVRPVAMMNVRTWFEGTYLSKLYGDLPISSQNLSEFMDRLGGSAVPMQFSERFIKTLGKGSPLIYDITSLSSASELMDILEYGYNRDLESMPQLNISIVAHKDLGVPIFYDVHPGSIVDVSTLKNTIKKLNALGLREPTMVMDKGFFSGPNLGELARSGYDYVMPATFKSKEVRSLVSRSRRGIESGKYLQMYEDMTVFVRPFQITLDENPVEGFVYYDMKREQEEKSKFYIRLQGVLGRLRARKVRDFERPMKVFETIAGDLASYVKHGFNAGRFDAKVRDKAVAQRVNRMGVTVVACRGGQGWEEALRWVRERDEIEKMFRQLKTDIEVAPLRVHKTEVAKGWIFVAFVSLILRSRMAKLMRDTGLLKDYSMPGLLLELGKLKRMELADGTIITAEVTKKQREIYEKLEIVP